MRSYALMLFALAIFCASCSSEDREDDVAKLHSVPGFSDDTLVQDSYEVQEDNAAKLHSAPGFLDETIRIQEIALAVAKRTYTDRWRSPDRNDLERIARLFEKAGILEEYDSFNDVLPQVVPTIDLRMAMGRVSVEVTGDGIDSITVELSSKSKTTLALRVPAGLKFAPADSNVQNMVAVRTIGFHLRPFARKRVSVRAACINMHRKIPKASDRFEIIGEVDGDLAALLRSQSFQRARTELRRNAIWTITDDPTRRGYVEVSAFPSVNTGLNQNEVLEIAALFEEAEISLRKYRVFGIKTEAKARPTAGMPEPRPPVEKPEPRPTIEKREPRSADERLPRSSLISFERGSGSRAVCKVRLHYSNSRGLSEDILSKLAQRYVRGPNGVVWFYLSRMEKDGQPFAVTTLQKDHRPRTRFK